MKIGPAPAKHANGIGGRKSMAYGARPEGLIGTPMERLRESHLSSRNVLLDVPARIAPRPGAGGREFTLGALRESPGFLGALPANCGGLWTGSGAGREETNAPPGQGNPASCQVGAWGGSGLQVLGASGDSRSKRRCQCGW